MRVIRESHVHKVIAEDATELQSKLEDLLYRYEEDDEFPLIKSITPMLFNEYIVIIETQEE